MATRTRRAKPRAVSSLTFARATRAAAVRTQLATYRERRGLTWDELQGLMARHECFMPIATLKRYGLGTGTPYATTTALVEKFLQSMGEAAPTS